MPDWRFQCPECLHKYDQHVTNDGTQGCCPDCGEQVRGRTIDEAQGQLERWSE